MGFPWQNLFLIFWLLFLGQGMVLADGIYAYTGEDGVVHLSNVPTNHKYRMLIPGSRDHVVSAAFTLPAAPVDADEFRYSRIITDAAQAYGLDRALLHAVITVESRYDPKAVSRKGAAGLMQLMPDTARQYGVVDVYDPAQNIQGGAKYLRDLLKLFNGDLKLSLAAYNAGENAVAKYGNRIPPFRETKNYVSQVMKFYREYDASLTD